MQKFVCINYSYYHYQATINYEVFIKHVAILLHVFLRGDDTLMSYRSMPELLVTIYPIVMFPTTFVAIILFIAFELPVINTFTLYYYHTHALVKKNKKEK